MFVDRKQTSGEQNENADAATMGTFVRRYCGVCTRTHVLKYTAGSLHIDPSGTRQKSQRVRAPESCSAFVGQTALGAVIVHCRLRLWSAGMIINTAADISTSTGENL